MGHNVWDETLWDEMIGCHSPGLNMMVIEKSMNVPEIKINKKKFIRISNLNEQK